MSLANALVLAVIIPFQTSASANVLHQRIKILLNSAIVEALDVLDFARSDKTKSLCFAFLVWCSRATVDDSLSVTPVVLFHHPL